jgi:hypothetical protein
MISGESYREPCLKCEFSVVFDLVAMFFLIALRDDKLSPNLPTHTFW